MRYRPPCTSTVDQYNTFSFSWAGGNTRTYATLLGNAKGTTSTTAPANWSQLIKFEVPRQSGLFGLEFLTQGTAGTCPNPWTAFSLIKAEFFGLLPGESSADIKFGLDAGVFDDPPLMQMSVVTSTVHLSYLDITGGGHTWKNTPPFYGSNALDLSSALPQRKNYVYFPGHLSVYSDTPWETIYLAFSATPGDACTLTYTLKVRPFMLESVSRL